jgi:hypothetical protein
MEERRTVEAFFKQMNSKKLLWGVGINIFFENGGQIFNADKRGFLIAGARSTRQKGR